MTKQKKLILEIVKNNMGHLTAEQVYEKSQEYIPNISLGTVYRNLNLLCEQDYIRRIKTPLGFDIYDKSVNPHGHMICPRCGKITDFHSVKLDNLLNVEIGPKLRGYQLILDVLCDDCYK